MCVSTSAFYLIDRGGTKSIRERVGEVTWVRVLDLRCEVKVKVKAKVKVREHDFTHPSSLWLSQVYRPSSPLHVYSNCSSIYREYIRVTNVRIFRANIDRCLFRMVSWNSELNQQWLKYKWKAPTMYICKPHQRPALGIIPRYLE